MNKDTQYAVSFTCGALLAPESVKVANVYAQCSSWEETRKLCLADNLLQAARTKTLQRLTQEIIGRLKTLKDDELLFLADADFSEQKYVLWLALCRRYALIGDFAREILHEFFASRKNSLTVDDYDIFFAQKALFHDELQKLSSATRRKIRQMLFSMMRDAGLIDREHRIIPCIPGRALLLLLGRAGTDAMFFPLPQGMEKPLASKE